VLAWVPVVALVRLTDRDPLRLRTARWFRRLGPLVGRLNPWRVHIAGRERIQPGSVYVVVSNHQSLADIPLIAHLRIDSKWLAKAELFDFPVFGWMMRMAGDIPVVRGDRRKAAQALLQCARYLRQRCSVVFFPEGTRSRTGEVLAFNDGPFQLAVREKIKVLPLAVEGSGSALPRNTWRFGGTQDIFLSVLEPIDPRGCDAQELRETVRRAISDEVARLARRPADERSVRRETIGR
jgi:1-acyl-sn-glycerol-3-phosphate acyltransferase